MSTSNRCIVRTSRDRKSTRLNSSHSSISYAVFCFSHHPDLHSFPTRRSSDLHARGRLWLQGVLGPGSKRAWSLPTHRVLQVTGFRQPEPERARPERPLLRQCPRATVASYGHREIGRAHV